MNVRRQSMPFGGTIRSSSAQRRPQPPASRQPLTAVVTRSGMSLVVKWTRPYPPYRAALMEIEGCRWDQVNGVWLVHVGEIRRIMAIAERFGWHLSEQVQNIPDLAAADFPILIRAQGEQLIVELPWREDVHPALLANDGTLDPATGLWFVPAENALDAVLDLQRIARVTVRLDGSLGDQITHATRMLGLSRAMGPTPGFELVPTIARDLSNRPFQLAGVEYGVASILARTGGCFLWGTMGSGKTAVALAILEHLDHGGFPTFPAVVVPPAGIKTTWLREAAAVLPHRSVYVCESQTPKTPLNPPDIWVCNYDVLGNPKKNSWAAMFTDLDLRSATFDEIHRVKELKTIRSRACQAISESLPPEAARLGLTGTPVRNRREEVIPQLIVIGRGGVTAHPETGVETVVTQFGTKKQLKADDRLSRRLRTICAWRPDPTEVLRSLGVLGDDEHADAPPNYVLVDGDPAVMADYRYAEEKFLDFLRDKAEEKARELGLDPHSAGVLAMMKAGSAAQLMQINALCRLAGQAKAKAAREWVEDFLTTDEKLLVFAHHRDVMGIIAGTDIPQIHGDVSRPKRDVLVDRFQGEAGDPLQALVLQTEAAGEGLTLTKAWTVLHAELEWVPGAHDQADARAKWRMNDPHNIQANFLVCVDTIDEVRIAVIQAKREEIAVVTDGDRDTIAKESTYGEVFEMLLRKALDRAT